MHLPEPDRARFVDLNRTTLRLWEWGDPTDPAVICAHGAYDHGRMFDEVAPRLAARGLHVVAPDLQGHGDSGRLSSGHVWSVSALDLALLARELGDPVGLVGHSFGGGQALYTAAIWPELVRWVVNIDGLGPSPEGFDDAARLVEAVTAGFDAAQRVRANPIRIYDSLASMANRRRRINVRLPEPWLEHLTRHGATPAGDGGWSWKADPMFNVGFVGAFDEEALLVQYRLVERPTLVLTGTEPDAWSDLSADDIGRRVEALGARHVAIDGAGHYVHCERPDATIAAISAFLDEVGP